MKQMCKHKDCEKSVKAKGFCPSHYQQFRRTGSPSGHATALDWLKANGDGNQDNCINWPFSFRENGYGQLSLNGRSSTAHRTSCKIFNGEPPSRKHEAAHSCGNKKCVNRKHLRWATPVENAADRIRHGTHLHGEFANPAKLTNRQAAMVFADNRAQRQIAGEFNVTQKVVCLIKQGKTYRSALGMM